MPMTGADRPSARAMTWRLVVAATATGVAAGIGGICLSLLLHLVQHLAFGYTEETFLTGVQRATAARRVLALAVGGVIVGLGWWALRRWARPVPSVEQVLAQGEGTFPPLLITADALLQVVAVGAGASLGREGAPRQVGAMLAHLLAQRLGLTAAQRRTIVACGAGAGLAAVYNVPLGGALFTLEILLTSAALAEVIPAVLSSAVATAVAWPVLSDRPTYLVPTVTMHPALLVSALLIGPCAGAVGVGFLRLTAAARAVAPSGWRLVVAIPLAFTAVGATAISFPQLLGNGKGTCAVGLRREPDPVGAGGAGRAQTVGRGGLSGRRLRRRPAHTGAGHRSNAGRADRRGLLPAVARRADRRVRHHRCRRRPGNHPEGAAVRDRPGSGIHHTGLALAVPTILAVAGAVLTAAFLDREPRHGS